MKDEALRLALEALEKIHNHPKSFWNCLEEITAIKQVLEQEKALQALHNENERLGLYKDAYGQPEPEPEPVAWMNPYGGVIHRHMTGHEKKHYTIPLYTSPPKREWQGLTDEEIRQICGENFIMLGDYAVDFIESIQAKLKEKNT